MAGSQPDEGGSIPTPPLQAYQKRIKDAREQDDARGLMGRWWDGQTYDIASARVQPIDNRTAKAVIDRYEWVGKMPAIVLYAFGIYFDDVCGGVVVYSGEYSENLGVWDKYGYTGKIILLSRGACLHWAPPHTGSKLISQSIRMLPQQYEIVTATVDALAGEIGTLYQACNFYYVGQMRGARDSDRDRITVRIGSKVLSERALRERYGTQNWHEIKRRFPEAELMPQESKSRYFYFRGDAATRNRNRTAIEGLIKPYPKRNTDA